MRNVKQIMIIISLFILLFAIVFVPMIYVEYQNNNILKEFFISPLKNINLDSPSYKEDDYNIWEHIVIQKNEAIVKATISEELKMELREKMEEQFAEICRYKALPDISLTGVMKASIFKETYVDRTSSDNYTEIFESNRVLNIWNISVEYKDYFVYACMDTQTNALYEIIIVTKGSDFLYQPGISDVGFLEYMLTFSDIPSDLGMAFSAGSYYSGGKICLYLYSVDRDSVQTAYRFYDIEVTAADPVYIYKDNK